MLEQMSARLEVLSDALQNACDNLEKSGRDYAEKEHAYRKMKATTYMQSEGTIPERNAQVDMVCETERLAAYLADAQRVSDLERVRSLRAELSATQTLINGVKEEMQFSRTDNYRT